MGKKERRTPSFRTKEELKKMINDEVEEVEDEDIETTEAPSISAMTGVVPPPPLATGGPIVGGGGPPVSPRTPVYVSGGAGGYGSSTTLGTSTPKKMTRNVLLPPKTTRKVLVAFLDEKEGEEDTIVWAAHLLLQDVSINMDEDPGSPDYMSMTFHLKDHYGNNK